MIVVNECVFPGLMIQVRADGQRQYLQVTDGKWTGRKWMLSVHMTEGEIVQTAFAAVMAWQEHETRESFNYRGKSVFNPHLDINTLLRIADETTERENSPARSGESRY